MDPCDICGDSGTLGIYGCYFGEYSGSEFVSADTRQDTYDVKGDMITMIICDRCIAKRRFQVLGFSALALAAGVALGSIMGWPEDEGGLGPLFLILGGIFFGVRALLGSKGNTGDRLVVKKFRRHLKETVFAKDPELIDLHKLYTRKEFERADRIE